MASSPRILHVAVPSPLRRTFDYRPPADGGAHCRPGMRVRVPFGHRESVGLILEIGTDSAVPHGKLRAAHELLDGEPLLSNDLLQLARWTMRYYHHAPGEVCAALLPTLLRQGHPAALPPNAIWRVTPNGLNHPADAFKRAPRQAAVMRVLQSQPEGASETVLAAQPGDWRRALRALAAKGWVEQTLAPPLPPAPQRATPQDPLALNPDQHTAMTAIREGLDRYGAFLLDGVTGSGKTEVYLQVIEAALAAGRQALVLVPEIGLTPQLVDRFRARIPRPIAVLHSGLSERERLAAWVWARQGEVAVVIGTRSALFTPLCRPGVIIVDEEHDGSYKQQDGFRYSARDLALLRGHHLDIPVVLGSATPSLESLHNARQGRSVRLSLPHRAGTAAPPKIRLLDVRRQPITDGVSEPLAAAMTRHLDAGNQVLVFLNRRGYAPVLLCHDCGWTSACPRCDAHPAYHQHKGRLCCHHCGTETHVPRHCPECRSPDLQAVGYGTERVEAGLRARFPEVELSRIDRDSTRTKGALAALLERARTGESRLLVGTQMLAKGHHFPHVTLVAILNADQGLFGADFRASERMAQLILQVAGRAGRADRPGEVLVQTHHPDHPLLQTLLAGGYGAFAEAALEERRQAALPPYSALALLRAEAPQPDPPTTFLDHARQAAERLGVDDTLVLGPVPAPMERRAGRYRAQLLLKAPRRAQLHALLDRLLPQLETAPLARRVRWSLDVDPMDML